MTDELDNLSDEDLNGVFIREVAVYERAWSGTSGSRASDGWRFRDGDDWRFVYDHEVPNFATDANAVLPWLEKWVKTDHRAYHSIRHEICLDGSSYIRLPGREAVAAPTFPRCACIALIRAKRAALKPVYGYMGDSSNTPFGPHDP